MRDHQESARVIDGGAFRRTAYPPRPTREQEEYAEAVAARYGRCHVSAPLPGLEEVDLGPAGAVVVTGLTDDIERSRAIVSPDGSAQVIM